MTWRNSIGNTADVKKQSGVFWHLLVCTVHSVVFEEKQRQYWLVAWLSGNALVSINEVTLSRARLVLGWVTVYEPSG